MVSWQYIQCVQWIVGLLRVNEEIGGLKQELVALRIYPLYDLYKMEVYFSGSRTEIKMVI